MIVGIDIDGTITRCPEFFSLLSKSLLSQAGNKVLIITFRPDPVEDIERELIGLGIAFNEVITLPGGEGRVFSTEEFVSWKAKVCKDRLVEIFFEDMPDVAAAVEPPTVVMLPLIDSTRRFMKTISWVDGEE